MNKIEQRICAIKAQRRMTARIRNMLARYEKWQTTDPEIWKLVNAAIVCAQDE